MYIPFGEWKPDALTSSAPDLSTCRNAYPTPDGYDIVLGSQATTFSAIGARVRGAKSGILQGGTQFVVAGTNSSLYLATGTTFTPVPRASPAYGFVDLADRWEFAIYGDRILATDYSDEVQSYTASTFVNLNADCSKARMIATVGEFIVLGNIIGQGANSGPIGTQQAGLHWCAIGDPTSWPVIGTAAAAAAQSDIQLLPPAGGRVTGIVPAAEYTLVLQERAVWRMDYVGAPNVFAFRQLDAQRGCHIDGAAISVGNKVYFPSRQGFLVCDGYNVVPIGYNKVDNYFKTKRPIENARFMSVAHSGEWKSVIWAMPTSGTNVTELLCYNYELDRWWTVSETCEWIVSLNPYGISLDDSPYATMSMDAASPTGLGDVQIDSLVGSYETVLGFFDTLPTGTLSVWSNATNTKQASITTHGFVGPDISRRFYVRWTKLRHDGVGTYGVAMAFRNELNTALPTFGGFRNPNDLGTCSIREGGRYGYMSLFAQNGISKIQGFEANTTQEGRR